MTAVTSIHPIRKLPYKVISKLCVMLDQDGKWKELSENIFTRKGEYRFSQDDISTLERAILRSPMHGGPSKLMLDAWGRDNATVDMLIQALSASKLYREADYLAVDILKGDPVVQIPEPEDFLLPTSAPGTKATRPASGLPRPPSSNVEIVYQRPEGVRVENNGKTVQNIRVSGRAVENSEMLYERQKTEKVAVSADTKEMDVECVKDLGNQSKMLACQPVTPASSGKSYRSESGQNVQAQEDFSMKCSDQEKINTYYSSMPTLPVRESCSSLQESGPGTMSENVERAPDQGDIREFAQNTLASERYGAEEAATLTCFNLIPGQPHHFKYKELQILTHGFDITPLEYQGPLIGRGGFGEVFLGQVGKRLLAIKRLELQDEENARNLRKQFETEVRVLSKYQHENLLQLLGFCDDEGFQPCIVYDYMSNGSLEERLACKNKTQAIAVPLRIAIMQQTARGINYLHTHGEKPLIHRDIKSANVLLDENFVAKIGDFGLARRGPTGQGRTATVTQNVIGTSVYMAPEAFHQDVSVKLDTYSYGVMLLEVLTGLPALDDSREDSSLKSHVEENCDEDEDILEMLDTKAGAWSRDAALAVFRVALWCVEDKKKKRPIMSEVLPAVEAWGQIEGTAGARQSMGSTTC